MNPTLQVQKRVSRVGFEPTTHGLKVRAGQSAVVRGGSSTGEPGGFEPLVVAGIRDWPPAWLSDWLSNTPPPGPGPAQASSGYLGISATRSSLNSAVTRTGRTF